MGFTDWVKGFCFQISNGVWEVYIEHFMIILTTHFLFFMIFWVGMVGSKFRGKEKPETIIMEEKLAKYVAALRKDLDKEEAKKETV